MSKNRMFNTKFWSDVFVVEQLNPLDKLLFLHLLLNDQTNLIGIYELSMHTAAFETGIDRDQITKMMGDLSPKIEYKDGWVYIRKFADHQQKNPNIEIGMAREVAALPENIRAWVKENGITSERLAKAFNDFESVAKPLKAFESVRDTNTYTNTKLIPNGNKADKSASTAAPKAQQPGSSKEIQEIWDFFIKSFEANPAQLKLSDKRKQKIKLRLKDAGKEMLFAAITNIANSPFHRGDNDRGWKADIDWILKSYEQVEKCAGMHVDEISQAASSGKVSADDLKRIAGKF
jgi:hypothetical protein